MIELVKDVDKLTTRAVEWDVKGNQDISTKLVQDLDFAMDEHKDLLFLCSQEVGHTERAIDVRFADDTYIFMNPVFKTCNRPVVAREFDRITEKEYLVFRFSNIELVFQDCLGAVKGIKLEGNAAIVLCQAMDMLDGVYPSDIGLEILPEFDSATPEEQKEVINLYLKSIEDRYNELDKELSSENGEIKDKWNAIKFMAAKSKGDIEEYKEAPLSKRKQKFFNNLVKKLKHNENRLKFWKRNKGEK